MVWMVHVEDVKCSTWKVCWCGECGCTQVILLRHGTSGQDLTNTKLVIRRCLRHTVLCMKLGENVLCTTLNILNDLKPCPH